MAGVAHVLPAPAGNLMAMSGFKNFIMRGNLVELAVAVVTGDPGSTSPLACVEPFVTRVTLAR